MCSSAASNPHDAHTSHRSPRCRSRNIHPDGMHRRQRRRSTVGAWNNITDNDVADDNELADDNDAARQRDARSGSLQLVRLVEAEVLRRVS